MEHGGPVRQIIGLSYRPARPGIDSLAPEKVYKYGLCRVIVLAPPGYTDGIKDVKPVILLG
jgi:hypothetical protein